MPKFIHVDLEKDITNAIKKIYSNIKIRYYLWHFKRNFENHKNQLCKIDVESDDSKYILYKCINNLPFICSVYIIDIFNKINKEIDNNNFKKFLDYKHIY